MAPSLVDKKVDRQSHMKVLHLTISFKPGGRRQAIQMLLEDLPRHGVVSELACLDEYGGPEQVKTAHPVEVIARRSALDFQAVSRLKKLVQRLGIDIIHAHDAASHYFAAMARFGNSRLKVMTTFHRSLGFETAKLSGRLRNAFAIQQSQVIVACSRERRQHYLDVNYVSPQKVVRIPLGIDIDRFQPNPQTRADIRRELSLEPDTVVIGTIGHFGPIKGVDLVIQGVAKLIPQLDSHRVALVILGEGTPEQTAMMHGLAKEIPVGSVIFAGYHQNIERWISAFDIYAHAPRHEAFGLAVIEAMACGLPVVATRVGGMNDIVRDGITGRLVDADNPDALAKALKPLVIDNLHKQIMGSAARKLAVEAYSTRLMAARYAQLYSEIMAGKSPQWGDDPPSMTDAGSNVSGALPQESSHEHPQSSHPQSHAGALS